jgi:hypothetical protein
VAVLALDPLSVRVAVRDAAAPGVEVDLLIERNRRLYAVEVKATATPTPAHAASLAQWLALAGRNAQGVLACRVEQPVTLVPGIRAVPWHLAWC